MKRTITFLSSSSPSRPNNTKNRISPGENVIRNILSYSKALAILKTEQAGTINWVMN
jgi:hypothetical protein